MKIMGGCIAKEDKVRDQQQLESATLHVEKIETLHVTTLSKRGDEEFKRFYMYGNKICNIKNGEVRKILRRGTDRKRAVKIYKRKSMQQKDVERLNRELDILEELNHPNIIRVWETYGDLTEVTHDTAEDKQFFVVTELCTGGQLYEEILFRTKLRESKAAIITTQILEALAYLNVKNIAHRDLKPENILLENKRNYIVKLIDFGVADRIKKNDHSIKEAVGTAYYIAPEVLMGECDCKCDMWSLGVILYMMISGKPPFEGADDREIIRKVRAGKYSMDCEEFDGISAECKDLIQWLLTREPKQRPHAKDALKH